MKYLDAKVTFAEIPDEITLCISLTNCPNDCDECHTPELRENIGTQLTPIVLHNLINKNKGITCICLMGGDSNHREINGLAEYIKEHNLKVGWYSGNPTLSKEIDVINFDYIKIGPYIKELGPLTSKTTNQRMFKVVLNKYEGTDTIELVDITYRFNDKENN